MGEDAIVHVRSPVGLFVLARGSLLFLVAMPRWQEYHSSDRCGWKNDSGQDGNNNNNNNSGWQSDGANGMYSGVQAAEGWGVRPGPRPQASKRLACLLQQQLVSQSLPPTPDEQSLTSNEFLSGFQAGYNAAYLAGWEQGYHMGKSHTLQMQPDKQCQGYQTNRRGACPDCSEEDEPDNKQLKKRKNKPLGFFNQWLEQYNMDSPVNLNTPAWNFGLTPSGSRTRRAYNDISVGT
jgi:hypothetical protein